jgi:hypothetical protein
MAHYGVLRKNRKRLQWQAVALGVSSHGVIKSQLLCPVELRALSCRVVENVEPTPTILSFRPSSHKHRRDIRDAAFGDVAFDVI